MISRILRLVVWTALLVHPLAGQEGSSPFSRLFDRYLDSLKRDTFVVRWGRDKTIGDALPEDMLYRLPDSAVVMFANVLAKSFPQAAPAECKTFLPGNPAGTPDLMRIANQVDSASAVQWVSVMNQMMLTGMHDLPRGHVLPRDSTIAAIRTINQSLSPEDRRRVHDVILGYRQSPADYCFVVEHVYRSLAALPARRAGPLFRAVLSQGLPSQSVPS